jgi:hypothetical protein
MRTGELNSEFAPVAKSAQLVFEQVNIQAQRFGAPTDTLCWLFG